MSSRPNSPPQIYPDANPTSLNRLLTRLEQEVLSADANPRLRHSSFERKKTAANIEHARTLLLSLEHTLSQPLKPPSTPVSAVHNPSRSQHFTAAQKASLQADFQAKRSLIKALNQRLYELDKLDDDSDEESEDEQYEEDNTYAPRVNADSGIESRGSAGGPKGADEVATEALKQAAQGLGTELRNRKHGFPPENDTATTATGSSLFENRKPQNPSSAEALLSHNRTEQETLTSSLLQMAQQLKSQSLQFGQTLEGDRGVVERAVEGLDSNAAGMEAASQRMGVLRRMTEGRGWWGRIKLYAVIFGMWVVAFLIVFVGPKIRL